MDDREYKLVMYQSLFKELESIEKNAMLSKEAVGWGQIVDTAGRAGSAIKGFGSKALQGAKNIKDQGLRQTGSNLRDAFETGAERGLHGLGGGRQGPVPGVAATGARGGILGGIGGGVRGVLGTNEGKALAVGAGGLGAAGLGAGALANRGR